MKLRAILKHNNASFQQALTFPCMGILHNIRVFIFSEGSYITNHFYFGTDPKLGSQDFKGSGSIIEVADPYRNGIFMSPVLSGEVEVQGQTKQVATKYRKKGIKIGSDLRAFINHEQNGATKAFIAIEADFHPYAKQRVSVRWENLTSGWTTSENIGNRFKMPVSMFLDHVKISGISSVGDAYFRVFVIRNKESIDLASLGTNFEGQFFSGSQTSQNEDIKTFETSMKGEVRITTDSGISAYNIPIQEYVKQGDIIAVDVGDNTVTGIMNLNGITTKHRMRTRRDFITGPWILNIDEIGGV